MHVAERCRHAAASCNRQCRRYESRLGSHCHVQKKAIQPGTNSRPRASDRSSTTVSQHNSITAQQYHSTTLVIPTTAATGCFCTCLLDPGADCTKAGTGSTARRPGSHAAAPALTERKYPQHLHCAAQHCTALHSTAQHCTARRSTAQHAVPKSSTQCELLARGTAYKGHSQLQVLQLAACNKRRTAQHRTAPHSTQLGHSAVTLKASTKQDMVVFADSS
jgi:hypothetical protein